MNSIKRGALIVFEGIDKSGKSTHSKRLVNSLQTEGYKAKLMSFPDRTTNTGNLINEYLKNSDYNLNNQTIHLLFSANRWENVDRIKALLFDGINLVIDRYSYSGIAYSVAKSISSSAFSSNHSSHMYLCFFQICVLIGVRNQRTVYQCQMSCFI